MKKFFPIVDWLSSYQKNDLRGDLFAGLTVGIMLIPQGMAYAMIAGLPPVDGLYASIVPQIIYAILGTSRQISVAPVAMDSLLVAAGVSVLATEGTEAYIGFAILLAFFMGVFQFLLGVLKLGFITNLLAKPVISGFTSAAALIIGLNQLKHLLGVEIQRSNAVFEIVINAINQIGNIHWLTFLIGIVGILAIKGIKKIYPKIPGALIAVALGTIIVYLFQLNESNVKIVGSIPEGLPSVMLPDLSLGQFAKLTPLALTISIVAFMEAFSVAKALEAKKRNYKVIPNQELIALGAANFFGSFFQSFPVTGGFSRSAVNFQAGANTPLASVFSAILVAITLIFLTPLFYFLPNAILASIIIVAITGLFDFAYAKKLWKEDKLEFALLAITFFVTLHFSMVPGIVSGVIFSILILLYKAAYPHIAKLGKVSGTHEFRNIERFENLEVWQGILILRLDAPLSFINIQYFSEYIQSEIKKSKGEINKIILDASPISNLDATATQGLHDLLDLLNEMNVAFLICDVIGPVRDTLFRTHLIDKIKRENVFLNLEIAIDFVTNSSPQEHTNYALQSNYKAEKNK